MIDAEPRPRSHSGAPAVGGLGAPAALLLVTVATVGASLLSASTGRGFGIAFNVVYALVTIYVALRIHVEDRFSAVVAPPLIYAAAMLIGGFVDSEETTHTLSRVFENTFINLSFGAPWLVGTTLATIAIALVRGRRAAVRNRH